MGALRGTTNNLATGLGTAFASVLSVSVLSIIVVNSLLRSPVIPDVVVENTAYLDEIDFISNDQLDDVLEETDLTPRQEAEVFEINVEARLQALKISFLTLACVAALAILPAGKLPDYVPGEVIVDSFENSSQKPAESS